MPEPEAAVEVGVVHDAVLAHVLAPICSKTTIPNCCQSRELKIIQNNSENRENNKFELYKKENKFELY